MHNKHRNESLHVVSRIRRFTYLILAIMVGALVIQLIYLNMAIGNVCPS